MSRDSETHEPKRRRWVAWLALGLGALVLLTGFFAIEFVVRTNQMRLSEKNLKTLFAAFKKYIRVNKSFPPAVTYDKHGNPLHSWRVLLLPHLGEAQLYSEFRLDEPWDSEHNKRLLPRMPNVYASPRHEKGDSSTFYQVFDGHYEEWPNAIHAPPPPKWAPKVPGLHFAARRTVLVSNKEFGLKPLGTPLDKINAFESTKSPTYPDFASFYVLDDFWLMAEAGEAVPWTKPADLAYHPERPIPKLGGIFGDGFHVCNLQGPVEFIRHSEWTEDRIRARIVKVGSWSEYDWEW
jgi:Protein of unknown function (DUF1559)